MFKVFLKSSNDRILALVAGPACSGEVIERWLEESRSDSEQFETAMTAIQFARDRDAAIISVRGAPGWPDLEIPDLERIIYGGGQ